jgi:meso-butanediol dehydrogenase/(S,S)-butanediol dehydrogenase/diacetyl reductase
MTSTAASASQVAIVTGGAHGLGEAVVGRFARDGWVVVIADINEPAARHLADTLIAEGLTVEAMTLDVTSEAQVAAVVDATIGRYGRLDALVCSAAIEVRASIVDCTDDDWQRVLDVNLKGPFLCMKRALPHLASGGGAVVLLGSVLGAIGTPGYPAYSASKGALNNLCKQAAIEHAADGVRVNVVSPSATDTGLFMEMASRAPNPEAVIEMVTRNSPMQRLGTGREVADTVAFLCSPGAAYISGAIIPVDGALAARRP